MSDTYLTLTAPGEGIYKEKMSKFLSFAEPCHNADEALEVVRRYRNAYCDARHCCWAYMLGPERKDFRANDDGEPSGTAGKPILGQINSAGLTDVVVIVVRYFGGIKLGTSGLIEAYREAAQLAIANAPAEERQIEDALTVGFEYPLMGEVMRIVKEEDARVVAQDFQMDCRLHLSIRRSLMPRLRQRFDDLYGATVLDTTDN